MAIRPFLLLQHRKEELFIRGPGEVQTYTAISRKVVGKSARDNAERYCGWF